MKNEINAVLENMTTTIPEPEDYTGEDGLLYCGKCRKPKEAYFAPDKAAIFGRDRHPAECDCQRTAREEREAAEKRRRHLDTVEELKRRGFTDPTMRDWTFENDNGRNPQTGLARRYVEHWEDMRTDNIGCLFWGGVGTGKSYLAGCIANALMEKEIPVRMTNFALILNDLAASFEGRNEYISRLCRYPLLILDDFGMERGTEYGLEQVFNVIDSRYRSGKPLIVTTNLTLDDLHNPAGHHYPDYMSYCIGLDSNVFYDDMDLMTAQVEENLKRKQCCGIKLYPGYNHVYVYDELYDPIYELARKYNKPVAIHTGLTATANALLKYSHPMTLDEAAVKYPDVQFVMCHIGNPFLQDAIAVLEKNHNVAVDLSGLLEGKIPDMVTFLRDKRGYISMLRDWLNYLGSYDRVMFGTDWPLANFADYITFVKDFIPETYWDDVFFNNANRIYQLGL